MQPDFYDAYFRATEHSPVHSAFCRHVFGLDLCQHGFTDVDQLRLAIQAASIGPQHSVLDVGCGNGMITEYLSDHTGARFTGVDNAPAAIELAIKRTSAKADRLTFAVGDINDLTLPAASYDDIVLIDSIYFSRDYDATLSRLKDSLRDAGCLLTFYSIGPALLETWDFPREVLQPVETPFAQALDRHGFLFDCHDLTSRDYQLARKRRAFLQQHADEFRQEGITFIYENRMGDSEGIIKAIEAGLHRRFLYCSRMPSGNQRRDG